MKPSEKFYENTSRDCLYNIQHIYNIPSIMRRGLLSNEEAIKYDHKSIAMNVIQAKRDTVKIPNGMWLHQYANLYFHYWNPMLSKLRDHNREICILKINASVLDLKGVILTDRNASSDYVAFYDAEMGLDAIDFSSVYAKYWTDQNYYNYCIKSSKKCAEVLVPYSVPYDYVMCAAVFDNDAKYKMLNNGFDKEILVRPCSFFRSNV